MRWKDRLHRVTVILMLFGIALLFSNHAAAQETTKQDDVFYYDGSNIKKYKGEHTFTFTQDLTQRKQLIEYRYLLSPVDTVVFASGCTFVPEGELRAFPNMKNIVLSETVSKYIDEESEVSIYSTYGWEEYGYYNYDGKIGSKLEKFIVDKKNPCFEEVNGILYDEMVKTLIKYPANSSIVDYVVPNTVTKVAADSSFQYANKMKTLKIGKNTKLSFQDTLKKI